MFDGLMVTITLFKLIDRSGTDPQRHYFYFICFLLFKLRDYLFIIMNY